MITILMIIKDKIISMVYDLSKSEISMGKL